MMFVANIYRPLDPEKKEIRLLRLYPSSKLDTIPSLDIIITSLDIDPLPYQALSYVWGSSDTCLAVHLAQTNTPVSCAPNLFVALQHIRHITEERIIWVDALCINQDDVQEREQQVRIMGLIYHQAEKVIAWVGEESKDSNTAINYLIYLSTIHTRTGHLPPAPGILLHFLWKQNSPFLDMTANQALLEFSKRPYWTRAWIFQEVALARELEVLCGTKRIDWRQLCRAISTFETFSILVSLPNIGHHPYIAHLDSLEYCWSRLKRNDMADLEHTVRIWQVAEPCQLQILPLGLFDFAKNRKATDPRDLIFSLYGFLNPEAEFARLIRPDYHKSLEQAYLDFAQYQIKATRSLSILSSSSITSSVLGNNNLPSWVPELGAHLGRDYIAVGGRKAMKTCHPSQFSAAFSPNGRVLSVSGFEIDQVQTICHAPFLQLNKLNSNQPDAHIQGFLRHIVDSPPIQGETSLAAFIRLWHTSQFSTNADSKDPGAGISWLATIHRAMTATIHQNKSQQQQALWYLSVKFLGDDATPLEVRDLMISILGGVTSYSYGHGLTDRYATAIFRTMTGRLGLAPEWVSEDDIVCRLGAHKFPILLRPCGNRYRNVGQCSVLDLDMKGRDGRNSGQYKQFDIV